MHRRFLTAAEVAARRPPPLVARLGLLGWVSAAAALAWLANALRPLLDWGTLDASRWGDDAMLFVRAVGEAAPMALPAALLAGVPGARRRNPWLLRGLVLVALAQVANPAFRAAAQWAIDHGLWEPFATGFSPFGLAMSLLGVAAGVLAMAGAWGLSDGLADAGARPRRAILAVAAGAGMGAEVLLLARAVLIDGLNPWSAGGLDLVRYAIGLAELGLWYVVGVRLLAGSVTGLEPRRAWVLGGVAGGLLLVGRLAGTALLAVGNPGAIPPAVFTGMAVASSAAWVLLLLAFALGLGRGTGRGSGGRRRVSRYELGQPARAGIRP